MNLQKYIFAELAARILVLDGAMGTMIQKYSLNEEDFRAKQFALHPVKLKDCNDLLNLVKPDIISEIHRQYLDAGADIIESNTFNGSSISLADYQLEEQAYKINKSGAAIAKKACDEYLEKTGKQCYVAGAIGPTNKSISASDKVNNFGMQHIERGELFNAYSEQIKGLIDGGVDLLLIETVFDLLNAKVALAAAETVMQEKGKNLAIILSLSITDTSGRILSGQTIETFLRSVANAPLLSIGLNCSFGAEQLSPFVKELSEISDLAISIYPNAGLPDNLGNYKESPKHFASIIGHWAEKGIVNIVGACCGTNPDYIREISKVVKNLPPRKLVDFD